MTTTNNFSGCGNRGFLLGSNSGTVIFNTHGQPETKPNPCSTVPFRRDSDFVDRDILDEISEKFSKPASHSRAALVGLGGVGKSQLAIEYSYRIEEQFPQTWIFWVHASNATRFEEGYRMIADIIKLPQRDEPTVDILKLVSNWLRDKTNGRWIMILDNADDPTIFSDPCKEGLNSENGDLVGGSVSLSTFLPQTPNGSILVTSRNKDAAFRLTGSHNDIVKVGPMDQNSALLLFGKKVSSGFDNEGDAIKLLRALDYMPLAISQAAAYISQRAPRMSVARYLNDCCKSDRNRANLLNMDAGDLRRDRKALNSIMATWQISFEYIREKRPSAARLLSLMSFFDRQGIPEYLLHRYDDRIDDNDIDQKDTSDIDMEDYIDTEFEEDLFTLRNYSLITTNLKGDQFEMHRLVQFSTRKWLELNREVEEWEKKYIKLISKAFPLGEYENWTICQVLFPHAEVILAYRRPAEPKYLVCWSKVLTAAAWYAFRKGNYLMAEKMNRQALEGYEKALGERHRDTLIVATDLARVLLDGGKYEEAEEMGQRALDGLERVLGGEHRDTLTSIDNLAGVLRGQGKYEAAEEMSRRALDGSEKVLGREHPDTLASVDNLALVMRDLGKYKAAEEMSRRALDGREKVLGKEHPDTLASVDNLALVMRDLGKYEAAEEMSRRALDGRERVLGGEHSDTLTNLDNLAGVLRDQGKYEVAEKMYQRALDGWEKVLGREHPDTLVNVNNLALVLHDQGKYEAAEEMNRRALDGREKVLGGEHPDTLASVHNLASVLRDLGKYEAAEEMSRRALDGRERLLGGEHPDTLASVHNLASVLRDLGKYEAAEEMSRRALDGRERVLGVEHPDTLANVNNLALLLHDQGKYEAAEEMSRRALDGREKVLGGEHPNTLNSLYCLAFLLHRQRRYTDATALYERSYAGFQKVYGINHPLTLACSNHYASMIEEERNTPGDTGV